MKKAAIGVVIIAASIMAWQLTRPVPQAQNPAKPVALSRTIGDIPLNLDDFIASRPDLAKSLGRTPASAQSTRAPSSQSKSARARQNPPSPKSTPAVDGAKPSEVGSLLAQAETLLAQGKRWDARLALSRAFFAAKGSQAEAIRTKLDALNRDLIFSPAPTPASVVHVVRPGESLAKIARQYGTSARLIQRVNHKKDPNKIRVGERLKVLKGTPSIIVDKSDLTLTLLWDGVFVKQYPCCIGQFDKTPAGTFVVDVLLTKPTWYAPDGKVYPYGNPGNLLGTRWIGFKETADVSGYGIHGTRDPSSVPGRRSMGCVRLRNEDVEEVYDFMIKGTKVEIRE